MPTLAAARCRRCASTGVDAIDVDRYLPPAAEGDGEVRRAPDRATGSAPAPPAATCPIELPEELLRQLDVDGTLSAPAALEGERA